MNDELRIRFRLALNHCGYALSDRDQRMVLELLPWTAHTLAGLKDKARSLSQQLLFLTGRPMKHTKALEVIARLHGHRNWHGAQQALRPRLPAFDPSTGWTVTPPLGHQRFVEPSAFTAPPDERAQVPIEMWSAFEAYFNHREAPAEWARAALEGRVGEAIALAGPLGPHVQRLMDLTGYYTWKGAFGSPEKVAAYLARPYGNRIPIGGLNVGAVLAALYNAAAPVSYGHQTFNSMPMTTAEGSRAYDEHQRVGSPIVYFDYLEHTRMKLLLDGSGWLDVERYEEGRFPGMAAYTVDVLREGGPTDARLLAIRHQLLLEEGKHHDIHLDTPDDDPGLTDTGRALLTLLQRTAPARWN